MTGPSSPAKRIRVPQKSPFCQDILSEPAGMVKLPSTLKYDGTTDPSDHLDLYQGHMTLEAHTDATWCKYFPTTLSGIAQSWFQSLPPGSIQGYDDLAERFKNHYVTSARQRRTTAELMSVRQNKEESLREYLARFSQETLTIVNPDPALTIMAFRQGLHDGVTESRNLKYDLSWDQQTNMGQVRALAQRYINNEDFRRMVHLNRQLATGGKPAETPKTHVSVRDRLGKRAPQLYQPQEEPRGGIPKMTHLNKPVHEIYALHKNDVKWNRPEPREQAGRRSDLYCDFHECKGHATEKCFDLKRNIEDLIRRGYFKQYRDWEKERKQSSEQRGQSSSSQQEAMEEDIIRVIP